MFHYLFPILTMGLALFIAWLKTVSYLGREDHRFPLLAQDAAEREAYEAARAFWAKIFAVNFAVGVVTGIPMEFQFGTNWARFSNYAGGVVGQTLAHGGHLRLLRRVGLPRRVPVRRDRVARACTGSRRVMVCVGSWLSGFFIIATNAWMQHPVGYSVDHGKAQLNSLWGLLTNPWLPWNYPHNMCGAAITGGFVLAAHRRALPPAGPHHEFARLCLRVGVCRRAHLLHAADLSDRRSRGAATSPTLQPSAFAAMEGMFETEKGAPLVIIGNPDTEQRKLDSSHRDAALPLVPDLAQLEREVKGLNDIPATSGPTRSRSSTTPTTSWSGWGRSSSRSLGSACCCCGGAGSTTSRGDAVGR